MEEGVKLKESLEEKVKKKKSNTRRKFDDSKSAAVQKFTSHGSSEKRQIFGIYHQK